MQIQFTVLGDDLHEIADELESLAAKFRGQVLAEKAVEDAKPEPEPKKKKSPGRPKKETKPEPEAKEEAPASSPADDWQTACNMLMAYWNENPHKKDDLIGLARSFGVQKFVEIPHEEGTTLLEKAKELVGA